MYNAIRRNDIEWIDQQKFDIGTLVKNIDDVIGYNNLDMFNYFMTKIPRPNINLTKKFHYACARGKLKIAQRILEIDPNITLNEQLKKDMLISIASGGYMEVLKYMFDNNDIGEYFSVMIRVASTWGRINIVKFLLEKDPSLSCKDAIVKAAINGRTNIVKYMIPFIKDEEDLNYNELFKKTAANYRYKTVKFLLTLPQVDPAFKNGEVLKSALYSLCIENENNRLIAKLLLKDIRIRKTIDYRPKGTNELWDEIVNDIVNDTMVLSLLKKMFVDDIANLIMEYNGESC